MLATLSLPASAVVTYHYSGHNGPNSEGTVAYPYVPLYASMTYDFTVATALAPNLQDVNILPSVLSWVASGGTALSTVTSSDPYGTNRLVLSTDGSGNITTFGIIAAGRVAAEPDTQGVLTFGRLQPTSAQSSELFQGYSISRGGSAFVSATCSGTGGCAGPTTFGIVPVPEPSTWLLLTAGIAGIGRFVRARRTID
jgi:YD repeat-containing protein